MLPSELDGTGVHQICLKNQTEYRFALEESARALVRAGTVTLQSR